MSRDNYMAAFVAKKQAIAVRRLVRDLKFIPWYGIKVDPAVIPMLERLATNLDSTAYRRRKKDKCL